MKIISYLTHLFYLFLSDIHFHFIGRKYIELMYDARMPPICNIHYSLNKKFNPYNSEKVYPEIIIKYNDKPDRFIAFRSFAEADYVMSKLLDAYDYLHPKK